MKIGYLCKYAPIEVLQSMGAEVERIMPKLPISVRRTC